MLPSQNRAGLNTGERGGGAEGEYVFVWERDRESKCGRGGQMFQREKNSLCLASWAKHLSQTFVRIRQRNCALKNRQFFRHKFEHCLFLQKI